MAHPRDSISTAKFIMILYKSVGLKRWELGPRDSWISVWVNVSFVLIWSWPSHRSCKIQFSWSPLNPPSITAAHPRHLVHASGRSFHMPWNQQRKMKKVVPVSGPQVAKIIGNAVGSCLAALKSYQQWAWLKRPVLMSIYACAVSYQSILQTLPKCSPKKSTVLSANAIPWQSFSGKAEGFFQYHIESK